MRSTVKRGIDESFILRALELYLLPQAHRTFLRALASRATICTYKQGEIVFKEGDSSDAFYLVRSGSMKVSKRSETSTKEVVINQTAAKAFGYQTPQDAIGRSITYAADERQMTSSIVGVVSDVKTQGPAQRPMPAIYTSD